ncbi:MAG: GntR family transcriptional regulator [Anaerolineae bacterium]|nr:GntR family transcriptional regulator [Anaerolineae bacterium]
MAKHDSPVPLYVQIEDYIRQNIQSGIFEVNERIPSERQLAEQFSVNRLTVSKAISELVQEGLLYTQVGKGTYVCPVKIDQVLQSLTSFTQDMDGRGKHASSRVLRAAVEPAGEEVAKALAILPGAEVFALHRVRMADNKLIALEKSHLIYALCPGILEQHDFSRESLYKVLRESYGIYLTYAHQTIEASIAEADELDALEATPCTPILRITRVTHDEQDRAIEFVRSSYRGDRYKFRTVLSQVE